MRRGDLRVLSGSYGVREFDVDDRDTSLTRQMLSGEAVSAREGAGRNYCRPIIDGQPFLQAAATIWAGIARSDSSESATVDGKIQVDLIGPGSIVEGDASTGGNIDSQSELIGLMFDFVAFDVSATSVYTIDEDENGSATNFILCIVGGDIIRSRVQVLVTKGGLVSGSISSV